MKSENYTFFAESQKSFLSLTKVLVFLGGFFAFSGFVSCSELPEEKLPVQRTLLTEVLFDLQMAQARLESRLNTDTTSVNWRQVILTHHGITSDQLDSSLKVLAANPDLFKEIQAEIQERISRVDRSLNNR